MNRFLSSKNIFTVTTLWILVIGIIGLIIYGISQEDIPFFAIVILSAVSALVAWVLLDTRYVLKNRYLLFRSGPFRGSIDIEKITKLKKHSGLYVPVIMKPALDIKGFILTYNKYDEIFISPQKSDIFIEQLKKINPNIEII